MVIQQLLNQRDVLAFLVSVVCIVCLTQRVRADPFLNAHRTCRIVEYLPGLSTLRRCTTFPTWE